MVLVTAAVITGVTVIIITACYRATSTTIEINSTILKEEDKMR